MLDAGGVLRDLSAHVSDWGGETVSLTALDALRKIDAETLPPVTGVPRIGPCVSWTPTFHCVGLNYAKHAAETGGKPPPEPILFSKAASALSGPYDPILRPRESVKLDYEVELGVVIGKRAEYVSERDALDYVAGYCVINDVSERTFQTERKGQWIKGKSAPSFGPVGPWLVTADEIPDPQDLGLWLDVNGETRQLSTTADMIFSVAEIIASMTRYMALVPGDVIATGTPEGVAMGMTPPGWLVPGDVVTLGVSGLGEQRQTVADWPG
jgi:2-keto-4-pentenoate hydratase/2-oxohepta-3-ene-1,7-dioic acid hydratase in catechol pathway